MNFNNPKNTARTFSYHDGGESRLKQIFNDPLFDENITWRKHTKNWALFYHLSPERKNLLRWINFDKQSLKILELGAGCGALTSYFASLKNRPQIVAVEGSPARAELIKIRCKNASNLQIITKNIQDYNDNQKYDFVSLVGVIEYAGKYIEDSNPFQKIIEKASSFLKPDGVLLIAIENQLGHKYLAGYNEDHYGKPFEGISNYPNYNGIKTFDKKTLQKMLSNAGLNIQQWFYPFPDYKMPKVILSDLSFITPFFEWLSLLNLPTIDYSSKQKALFNERAFLKILQKNCDISNFMNSFLVCASKNNNPAIQNNIIASSMQFALNPKFQSIKDFVLEKDKVIVKHKRFDNNNLVETTTENYHIGFENLLHLIIDAWQQKKHAETTKYLLLWLKILQSKSVLMNENNNTDFQKFCITRIDKNIYPITSEWLSGNFIDLILRNCLLNKKNDDIKIIDQEWKINTNIPLKLIIDRGMYYLQLKMKQFTGSELLTKDGNWNLPLKMLNNLPKIITKPNIKSLIYFEYWFQKTVKTGTTSLTLDEEDLKKIKSSILSVTKTKSGTRKLIVFAKQIPKKLKNLIHKLC